MYLGSVLSFNNLNLGPESDEYEEYGTFVSLILNESSWNVIN